MDRYRLKLGTNPYKLALFLFTKGSCYKQDLLMYAYSLTNNHQSNSSSLVKTLNENNIVYFKDFKLKTKTVSVAYLTEQGRKQVIKLADIKNTEYYDKLLFRFNTKVYDKLLAYYNDNHIKTMFNCVDIPTDALSKPTLHEVYNYINKIEQNDNFLSYTPDEIQEYLDKGIYYSKEEYREFYKLKEVNDEVLTSVFRGLFISTDKCAVVYSNGKDNNKMIYLAKSGSEFLLTKYLIKQRLAPLRTVNRKKVGLYALTMSDANSFIYSSAVGRKRGEVKSKVSVETKSFVFTPYSNINYIENDGSYCGMYSVIFNKTGVQCLQRFVSNPVATTYTYPKSLPQYYPDRFSDNQGEYEYPINYNHNGTWLPCCYIPIYDLMFLNQLKSSTFTPAIITDKDMINVISRITHKPHIFLDINTLKPINEDVLIYDDKGYVKGKKMLQDYFLSLNQRVDDKQFKQIPAKYGMSYNQFYNALALGQLSIQDVAVNLNPRAYHKTHTYRTKKTNLVVPYEIYLKVKSLAQRNHNTIQYTTTKLLNAGLNFLNQYDQVEPNDN